MHRVELKGLGPGLTGLTKQKFLMHRVELKVGNQYGVYLFLAKVPNAPCGVERK